MGRQRAETRQTDGAVRRATHVLIDGREFDYGGCSRSAYELARADLFEIVESHRIHLDSRLGEDRREVRVTDRPLCILSRVVGLDDDYEVGVVKSAPDLVRTHALAHRARRRHVVEGTP